MKEYEVYLINDDGGQVYLINDDGSPMLQKDGSRFDDFSIKAESPKLAYEAFVKSIKSLPFAKIRVTWGFMGSECDTEPPHYEGHKSNEEVEKERLSLELKKQEEAEKKFLNNLIQKITSEGFQKLSYQEVEGVGEVMDEVLTAKSESEEKLDLAKVTLMDEQAYKFYTLRSNTRSSLQQEAMLKAMNVNLSDISNKTGGIKTASMFTGMAAARHLGEEIAEDFGGEDE